MSMYVYTREQLHVAHNDQETMCFCDLISRARVCKQRRMAAAVDCTVYVRLVTLFQVMFREFLVYIVTGVQAASLDLD